ncbi:MAG: hypothetical protein FWG51_02290 [Firmicutes bacterium]|nr:hypothetical protein [Bacillota bacterium]
MKNITGILILAIMLLISCFSLAGCDRLGDEGGSDTEPYISSKNQSYSISLDQESAGIYFKLVNPTGKEWEVVVHAAAKWTFKSGTITTAGADEYFRLAINETLDGSVSIRQDNTGSQISKFEYTITIKEKEEVEPDVWGSIFSIDWQHPYGYLKMKEEVEKKGGTATYNTNQIYFQNNIYPEYGVWDQLHAFFKATRTLGTNVESYEIFYFSSASNATWYGNTKLVPYGEANSYECTIISAAVVLNLLP